MDKYYIEEDVTQVVNNLIERFGDVNTAYRIACGKDYAPNTPLWHEIKKHLCDRVSSERIARVSKEIEENFSQHIPNFTLEQPIIPFEKSIIERLSPIGKPTLLRPGCFFPENLGWRKYWNVSGDCHPYIMVSDEYITVENFMDREKSSPTNPLPEIDWKGAKARINSALGSLFFIYDWQYVQEIGKPKDKPSLVCVWIRDVNLGCGHLEEFRIKSITVYEEWSDFRLPLYAMREKVQKEMRFHIDKIKDIKTCRECSKKQE